jgi:hypothetical protein
LKKSYATEIDYINFNSLFHQHPYAGFDIRAANDERTNVRGDEK